MEGAGLSYDNENLLWKTALSYQQWLLPSDPSLSGIADLTDNLLETTSASWMYQKVKDSGLSNHEKYDVVEIQLPPLISATP